MSPIQEQCGLVCEAIGRLVDEHGSPNRFHTSEIEQAIPGRIKAGAVGRVGRNYETLVARSCMVTYKRGWFDVRARGTV